MKLLWSLVLIAVFTGCCNPPTLPSPAGQLGETPILSGKAQNWLGRALTIKLEVTKRSAISALEYVATGSIDAAGNFSIALPGRTTMQPYLESAIGAFNSSTCPTIKVSPNTVKNSNAVALAVFDGNTKLGYIALEPSRFSQVGDTFVALVFFDAPANFQVVCTGTITNHLHTDVGLGWNYDINELYAPNLSHEYVGKLPEGTAWTYSDLPPP
jgi:hypothetical protein